jgi:threonine/homoserine/homoserine lactone efflux protein
MLPTSSILAVFLFSFAVGFGAVITPGPVSTAIVTQAPRRGWIVGPIIATGHAFLEFLIVILIAYGLTTRLAHPNIQTGIALVGGVFLLWMGASMVRDGWNGRVQISGPETQQKTMSNGQILGLGLVTTLSNPFWYAWWVTVAAGYLAQAQSLGISSVAAFYLGHISADYTWDTILSSVIGRGRNWITPKMYQGLILICGGFLVYLGFVFCWME